VADRGAGGTVTVLRIDPAAPEPPYEQLRGQLVAQIGSGELAAGTRLPTVRRLAEELGLAPNTVARAYRELEQAGVLETRGRGGTFVALSRDELVRSAHEAALSFVARLRELGVPDAEAPGYLSAALRA